MKRLEEYLTSPGEVYLLEYIKKKIGSEESERLIEALLSMGYEKAKMEILNKMKPELRVQRAIFSNDIRKCEKKIRELIGDEMIFVERLFKSEVRFETLNDIYIGVSASQSNRGMKNHYVYIDSALDDSYEDIISQVLIPSCSLAPQMYPEGVGYDWRNHIKFFSF